MTLTANDGSGTSNDSATITVTIYVTDVDEEPEITSSGSALVITGPRSASQAEGVGGEVATYSVSGGAGGRVVWGLTGSDAGAFKISSSGVLAFKSAPDYEAPTDDGRDNSYMVTVTAKAGEMTTTRDVTVTVTNVNESPEFGSATTTTRSVVENTAAGMDIGAAVAATDADNDTLTYTLGGDDAASFDIDSATGQIMTFAALDFEAKASYTVDVTATDDGRESDTIAVTINVTEVNEAPEFDSTTATRSVVENTAAGVNIGDPVAAADANTGDTLAYTLGGDDAASFAINRTTGQLMTKAALDFEAEASYTVEVTATDGAGESDAVMVTITVTNMDEMGMVTLSDMQPRVGVVLTAMLSDDDMAVEHMATVTWQWASSDAMDGTYTNIEDDATSASYTPVDGDENMYLRATATYTDGYGAQERDGSVGEHGGRPAHIGHEQRGDYAENGTGAGGNVHGLRAGVRTSASWSLEGDGRRGLRD